MGVPRFEELINASDKPKTPNCSIIFNGTGPGEIDKAVEISFKIVHLIIRNLVSDSSIELIHFAKAHPMYYLMPDVAFKRIAPEGNWCVKLVVPVERLIQYQVEFEEVLSALYGKFTKGINIAYTFDPVGNSVIHIGNYGKKNNKASCAVLRNRLMNCHVRGVPNIELAEPCLEDGKLTVETVGTNIYELYKLKLDYVCVTSVMSNHPFDVLEKFGIEAARKTLYQQCHRVLSFDGSYVSCRHYQVMVSRMTFSGTITATTRHGIAKYENKSPLARATFEQPVEVLLNAATKRKSDPLTGVSEQILMGIMPKIGTADIDVLKTEEYKKLVQEAAEEDSDDDDDGWLQFDTNQPSNPFAAAAVTKSLVHQPVIPMLQPPMMGGMMPTPMWAQQQHATPYQQNVVAAVGQPDPWALPANSYANPGNPFAAPQMNWSAPPVSSMFAPMPPGVVPTSPTYDPNRPTSPAYDPLRPTSPAYDPNRPTSPAYDPNKPTSPAYHPHAPDSPMAPEYEDQGPVYNVGYDSDDSDIYDPNKTY